MAGGSNTHARLCTNASAALFNALRGKPCAPVNSEQRVRVEASGLQTYPDASVYCPEARFEGAGGEVLLDPCVIIEVLSPSTADYDRVCNAHYQQIATLTDSLLVAQDRVWVEHYQRSELGWLRRDYSSLADTIALPSVEATLPLSELYDGLNLPSGLPSLTDLPRS